MLSAEMDTASLTRYLHFAVDELTTRNGQFEFEALCQELIKARVASNLVTATGPVAAKGDQGRDAETYVSYLAEELGPHSAFLALLQDDMAAVCCTLQRDDLKSKFEDDAKKVVSAGAEVQRIYAMCSTPVAVGVRHEMETAASKAAGDLPVQIFDAVWIAEQLADPDLFWIAERYLQLDEAIRPPAREKADGLERWYLDSRDRWHKTETPSALTGDFYELRAGLREAKEPGPARPDLPLWLERMERLLAETGDDEDLAMRAHYEIAVCTLIGKRDLRPADHHVETFFEAVLETDQPFRLLSAQNLLSFLYSMVGTGRSGITPEQIATWNDALCSQLTKLLEEDPPPTRRAFYRFALGRLLLHTDPARIRIPEQQIELPEIDVIRETVTGSSEFKADDFVDAPGAVETWLVLLRELPDTALFPIESLSETVSFMTGALYDVEGWNELTTLLDEKLASNTGRAAAAAAAFDRAAKLAEAERPLEAIAELHSAKVDWFGGDTVRKSIHAMLSLSTAYLELELPAASKMYALAAAYAAGAAENDEATDLVPDALSKVARADFFAGRWLTAARSGHAAIAAAAEQTPTTIDYSNPKELEEEVLAALSMMSTILTAARDFGSDYEHGLDPLFEGPMVEIRKSMLDQVSALTIEEWRDHCDELGLVGPPFADGRPLAPMHFAALGIDWSIAPVDAASIVAAERLAAAAAILSADLARHDLCLLAGRIDVEVGVTERRAALTLEADDVLLSAPAEGGIWSIKLGTGEAWLADPHQVSGELFTVLMAILTERSLLPIDRIKAVVGKAAAEGALGNLFAARAYDELVTSLLGDPLALAADLDPPWSLKSPTHPALAWRREPGPTYDSEKARLNLQSRYEKLPRMCRATLPRLLKDDAAKGVIERLRADGWLDWQILQAIHGVITQHRMPDGIETWSHKEVEAFLTAPEDEALDPVPPQAFTEEELRKTGSMGMLATLQVLELESHTTRPDREAIRELLVARYAYSTDDIDHVNPFAGE
jgi:hypothetical protein